MLGGLDSMSGLTVKLLVLEGRLLLLTQPSHCHLHSHLWLLALDFPSRRRAGHLLSPWNLPTLHHS